MSKLVFEVELDAEYYSKMEDEIGKGAQVVIQGDDWKPMDDYPPIVLRGKLKIV